MYVYIYIYSSESAPAAYASEAIKANSRCVLDTCLLIIDCSRKIRVRIYTYTRLCTSMYNIICIYIYILLEILLHVYL